MAVVLDFHAGSEGDPSVGMHGYEEKITVIFHDRTDHRLSRELSKRQDESVSQDEIQELRGLFADFADGYCKTGDEWITERIGDAIANAMELRDWQETKAAER